MSQGLVINNKVSSPLKFFISIVCSLRSRGCKTPKTLKPLRPTWFIAAAAAELNVSISSLLSMVFSRPPRDLIYGVGIYIFAGGKGINLGKTSSALLAFSRVGGANWSGLFTQSIHCSRGVKGAEVEEWTRASFLWKSLGGHNIKTYIQYIHPRNIYKLYNFFFRESVLNFSVDGYLCD